MSGRTPVAQSFVLFKGVSATMFLRRSWKILRLTTSIRRPKHHVNAQYPPGWSKTTNDGS